MASRVIVLFLLLSLVHCEKQNSLQDTESFVNCITDAIVLEGILLRSAAELASGIYIPNAVENLKHFWSLLPEWTATCKGIFKAAAELEDLADLEEFPELPSSVIAILRSNLRHSPSGAVEVPTECVEGFVFSAKQVYLIGQHLNSEDYGRASELLLSLRKISTKVIQSCQ